MNKRVYYQKLKNFIEGHGINLDTTCTFEGYSLTVEQYITAVSIRDKQRSILTSMGICKDQQALLAYLQGAISSVISNTLAGNPNFISYYENKLKKVN